MRSGTCREAECVEKWNVLEGLEYTIMSFSALPNGALCLQMRDNWDTWYTPVTSDSDWGRFSLFCFWQIVAFAVFNDQVSALAAKAGLNGHKIDPDLGATLNIELAKSNSRGKRPHSDEHEASEKKFRGSSGMDGIYSDAGLVHSVYDLHGYPPSQSSAVIGGYVIPDGVSGFMMV
ncbi:hypothetical protein L7F22_007376 [Adiantum nelumboides]|nr:hypothetical protein [Adiantum nelumboides]